jgi:tetratricopeptide (TPR) repeat protein
LSGDEHAAEAASCCGKGKEAVASVRPQAKLSQLWQLPLLLVSLGLFGYAAWLFIDPKPGLTLSQRIDIAEEHFHHDRFEAAIEQCNKLLTSDKLKPEDEGRIHLLLAKTLEAAQKSRHISIAGNYERIIEQTRLAMSLGLQPTAETYLRLAESHEALGHEGEALDGYRRAMAMDSARSLPLQRKVIELQLAQDDTAPAEASIEEYLRDPKIADAERAWALAEKAQALSKRGNYIEARPLLDQALRLDPEPLAQGVAHYRLGYCIWKLGDPAEAERILRVSRDQLKVGHPLDAEAAYALANIRREKSDFKEAIAFYESVIISHPESRPAPLARLGRGICRLSMQEDEPGLTDLHDVVTELGAKKNREKYKDEVIAGLRQASAMLAARGNLQGALEVLTDEQILIPEPDADFFARLASVYEKRADQLDKTVAAASNATDKLKREEQVRKLRTQAGDSYIAYSRALTLNDDTGHGEAMWKGVDLYDRAGAIPQAISALELFVAERPDDGQAPDALLRLGRAYQAVGQFDKAITAFQRNQFRYPQSLAASKSGVPLAQAYIAKGPESYAKAEKVLLAVVENNPILTPDAEEFRQALFDLSQLYYRTGRYEEAVARLEETTQRYPKDERTAELVFLMADSYRKSAILLAAKDQATAALPLNPAQQVTAAANAITSLVSTNPSDAAAQAAAQAEAAAARKDRLSKAKRLFDRVIELNHEAVPSRDLDKLYLKLSHFYRADCLYDLGQYEDAIKLYDAATLRYQDDPSAVAAYVQIVNSYCALGRMNDARTANERAKWLLRNMPARAFEDGKVSMPKQYWDDWLKWTGESGLWKQ